MVDKGGDVIHLAREEGEKKYKKNNENEGFKPDKEGIEVG